MNFSTFQSLLITSIFLFLIVIALGATSPDKNNKKKEYTYLFLMFIFSIALFSVVIFGKSEKYANGIRFNNESNDLSLFTIIGDESYEMKIKPIGKLTFSPNDELSEKFNNRILVRRSILKGTQIYLPKKEAEQLSESIVNSRNDK